MFGHDYITQHVEAVTRAYFIEYLYEDIARIRRSHEWLSLITTAGDVVVVVKAVDSDQIARLDNPLIEHRDEWGTRQLSPQRNGDLRLSLTLTYHRCPHISSRERQDHNTALLNLRVRHPPDLYQLVTVIVTVFDVIRDFSSMLRRLTCTK